MSEQPEEILLKKKRAYNRRMKFELAPDAKPMHVPAASSADFERCNGCKYVFKKRGHSIDMKDMLAHKATCPGWNKKVRIK